MVAVEEEEDEDEVVVVVVVDSIDGPWGFWMGYLLVSSEIVWWNSSGYCWPDGPTNGPTDPLMEMRGQI